LWRRRCRKLRGLFVELARGSAESLRKRMLTFSKRISSMLPFRQPLMKMLFSHAALTPLTPHAPDLARILGLAVER
jgi:hypothetical protein